MNRTEAQKLSKQALEELAARLAEGRSESLTRLIQAMARFHGYSWSNVLMILGQRPDATRVAGVDTWNRLRRQVRRGEKGIAIFAPIRPRALREAEDGKGEERRVSFRVVHVFDIAQTDGEPLPEIGQVAGEPGEHLAALKRVLLGHGIALEYHDDLRGALGRSCNGTIKLVRGLTPAREFSVLAHELAHELMHQGMPALDRGRAELEAEAVASVLCRFAGLDAGSAHSDYIQLYSGGREALADSLGVIQRNASGIIEAMAGAEEVRCDGQTRSNQPLGNDPGPNSKEDYAELV